MAKGIFVGLSTVDVIHYVDSFPKRNSKVVARSQGVLAGGPATNAAITYSFLGGQSTLVAVVGHHSIAKVLLDDFEQYSLQLIDLNPEFAQSPTISAISVNQSGERNVISVNAASVDAILTDVEGSVLADASIVLVDGHQMKTCQSWARAAHDRGIPVVLDGGSWKNGTRDLLKNVDVAICSADFMPPMCSTEEDVLKYLVDSGVPNIAISHGAEPIRFVSAKAFGDIPVPQVQVADTMGAGDILHGAFCFFASTGNTFTEALTNAAGIAAESCRFRGTREWMNHLQVNKQDHHLQGGQIVMPAIAKSLNQHHEPSEIMTDKIALETLKWTRRAFCVGIIAAGLTGIQTISMIPELSKDVEARRRKRIAEAKLEDELQELLACYLYPTVPGSRLTPRVPLVPPLQDPWGPPRRQFSGSGNAVAAAYLSAFASSQDKHIVEPELDFEDDDAPVLIASHLVSEPAARYFGDPASQKPIHKVQYHGKQEGGGFKANLRWAIFTPPDAKVINRRELFQEKPMLREEPVHEMADLDAPRLRQPDFVRQGDIDYQLFDYFLITVLPRDAREDRRMISLAGLHKPGTLAAEQLLSDRELLLKILRRINEEVNGLPYYQALIRLGVDYGSGLPRPKNIELMGVHVIKGISKV